MKSRIALLFILTVAVMAPAAMAADVLEGFSIQGFVDTSYFYNQRSEANSFTLDQGEVDVVKTIPKMGGIRVDVNHLNGQEQTTDNILEQGYIWIDLPQGLKLTFGKINCPIGFESVDRNAMYQWSHALVFNYGLPTNVTGAMLSGARGIFDLQLHVTNGWDLITDNNRHKTFGGRLGVTPRAGVNIGFSAMTGKEGSDENGAESHNLTALDMDTTLTLLKGIVIGGELNWGSFEDQSVIEPGADAEWKAWEAMINFPIKNRLRVTFRYDGFLDEEGARLGSGVKETRNSFTFCPIYEVGNGFKTQLEIRQTVSDKPVFLDRSGATNKQLTEMTLGFTYSF